MAAGTPTTPNALQSAVPQTRTQLYDLLVRLITDPLNRQNTPAKVRQVLRAVIGASFNPADDQLSVADVAGLAQLLSQVGILQQRSHLQNTDAGTNLPRFEIARFSQNQEQGEQITAVVFAGAQGGARFGLGVRWQRADNTAAADLVYCASYTNTTTDVWAPLFEGQAVIPYSTRRDFAVGELVSYRPTGGELQFYNPQQPLSAPAPAPPAVGSDANWLLASGPGRATVLFRRIAQYDFVDLLAEGQVRENIAYRLFDRVDSEGSPLPDVVVYGLADGSIRRTAVLDPDGARTEGTYDLATDTFTPDTGGGPGGGPTVVQTTGTSTADVMSQKATTDALAGKAALSHTHTASQITDFNTAADGRITAQKGTANGLAPLGSDSKIAAAYLPSYVDDVLEYAALANFPATGETGKIYVATGANTQYRWSGSAYVQLVASPGSTDAVPEGAVNKYFTDARAVAAANAAGVGKELTANQLAGIQAATGLSAADRVALLSDVSLSDYLRPGTSTGSGNVLLGPPDNGCDIAGTVSFSTILNGNAGLINGNGDTNAISNGDSNTITNGIGCAISDSKGCTLTNCENVKLESCTSFTLSGVTGPALYINNVLYGAGLDIYDVPAAKRNAVVAANSPAVAEMDAAYYGKEFYDEVTTPGTIRHYRCGASVQGDGSTAWKWFRSLIQ